MPWRVGRDLRQLSQAANRVLERIRAPHNPLCVIAQPLHSTRRLLWPPAVALKFKHSHAPTAGNTSSSSPDHVSQEAGEPSGLRTGGSKEGAGGNDPVSHPPPPEVLSALTCLFARHPTRCTMPDLRRSRTLHVVPLLRHPVRGPALVLHILKSNGPDFALWTLRLASEVGQSFPVTFYGQLAALLVSRKRWRDVLRVGHLARQSLGHTTTALLNWRLQALMEIPHFVPVEEALALFEKEGVAPSRLTYHLLVSMHLRNHDLPSALGALSAMESAGFPVTSMTCAIVMLNYRSCGLTSAIKAQALDALRTTSNGQVASAILNGLVQLMLDAGDMSGVVAILSSLTQVPEDPSSGLGASFTPEDGAADESANLAAVTPTSLTPRPDIVDVTTYNILLEYLADQGDLPRGIRVLQEMRAADIRPNSRTAAALAHLYFATGQANDALHVVATTLVNLPAAVSVLPRLGFTASIPPEQPIPPPTRPTIEIFNTLLLGTLRDHGLKGLHAVLSMMRIAEVEADATTLTVLLSHKHRRELASPRELIRIVRILMSQGVTPTMQHLHVLLGVLLRQEREGTRARGWHVFPHAKPEPSEPITEELVRNAYSHPIAGITFPTRRKHRNLLRPIVQSLTDRGVQSDRVVLGMRIKQDAVIRHDMEAATQAFRAMVDSGIQPNVYHYAALMEGYAQAGDMEAAEGTLRSAMEAGVRPNVKAYTILIFGYARFARPSMAVKVFRKMVAQGVRPDVPAVDALVSAFFRAKAYGMARRVLLRLWPQVAPLEDEMLEAPLRDLAVAFRELHVANEARERLTSEEQRALRGAIREIAKTWNDVTRKGLKGRKRRSARAVVTRKPEYTEALGG
ncbi:hypothetical protein OH76DRAFT_1437013 [Lentinus brumalis]|uniref:Pentacotripeptide-repeat region of PRORP domain-containing protein n=1 Tax=Lentinus brumalis TaxID=2498619 RepID=A0A371DCX4_9APHY|nr:hypothetical protein OH76DRAFT_1437013 [Polyporus brumalis]